jgi:uncharacterized membrane protein YcaP (DUF421 family)
MDRPWLDGHFASEAGRRFERRWQLAGLGVLTLVVAAALAGLVGRAETVLRAAAVYAFLLGVFRVSGRRTLAQVTTFDLVLVLIIGDAAQQALVGTDDAVMTGVISVSSLVLLDVALAAAKFRWPVVDAVFDGLPIPLVVHGQPLWNRLRAEGVSTEDLIAAARESRGVTRFDRIDTAVLEQNGAISIVPANGKMPGEPQG